MSSKRMFRICWYHLRNLLKYRSFSAAQNMVWLTNPPQIPRTVICRMTGRDNLKNRIYIQPKDTHVRRIHAP